MRVKRTKRQDESGSYLVFTNRYDTIPYEAVRKVRYATLQLDANHSDVSTRTSGNYAIQYDR